MRHWARALARRFGFDVTRTGWEGWTPAKLRQLSSPSTVIDVGVWHGTPDLYAAFPDAQLLLVDPLPEAEPHMRRILAERPGVFEAVALGSAPGEAHLSVPADTSTAAVGGEDGIVVPVDTLDAVVDRHDLPAPYLLKIDAEGHEGAVLEGAATTLRQVDCVIAEILFPDVSPDVAPPSALIGQLAAAGFELAEVLELRRGTSTLVRRIDAAFTRR